MLLGAIDPLEGALLILPGSALVALAGWVGRCAGSVLRHRLWVFVLIAFGLAAMFGLTAAGGFGGDTGRSMWWGLLVLPYLLGWSLGVGGPGLPRWLTALGLVAGWWYVALPVLMLVKAHAHPSRPLFPGVLITIGAVGVLTIVGCLLRLRRPPG